MTNLEALEKLVGATVTAVTLDNVSCCYDIRITTVGGETINISTDGLDEMEIRVLDNKEVAR